MCFFFFLMILPPPISTRTVTLLPYTTLFRSAETLQNRLLGTKRALGALGATAFIIVGLGFLFKVDEISRLGFTVTFGSSARSEEHTSELQSLMRISYAVFCLKKKTYIYNTRIPYSTQHNNACK